MKIEDTIPIFPISTASKLCEVPIRMLREYEKQGLIRPKKINGRRMFTPCEIGFVKDIRFYLTKENMTIKGLKEFYFRAGCWQIKRCDYEDCPAYGKFDKNCWRLVKAHKKCDPSICPYCPIYIVKTSFKKKETKPISPRAYSKK